MIIPLDEIPCPRCDATGAERVGVHPLGLHVELECSDNLCQLVWAVSG